MGFMDKVKEQASVAAAAAKDAAQKGQAKVEEVQAKRAADGVLRELGLAVYFEKTNRATPTTESNITNHVETLQSYEAEHGALDSSDDS
jgi:hypothetical protein